ncbi:hypothetical protein [Arcanobacterium phocae]|uniref:Shikimate kinase n=1 Tax=Arcanobacterium phocae TaxID=131112 RepID=A0A1H2LK32_9ACTO|nr:hypothetical protein [Arcanobacterium phocae]SDU81095.1 shikimate kinase [Arcanobacterium phocae]
MTAIVIIGPDGAGKTTLVAGLETHGYTVADVDTIVAEQLGVSDEDLFTEIPCSQRHVLAGDLIRDLFTDIAAEPETDFAVALPADFFEHEYLSSMVFDAKREARVFVLSLECSVAELVKRLGLFGPRATNIVLPRKELRMWLNERMPQYQKYADWTLDTTGYTLAQMADAVPKHVIMLINSASSPS